MKNESGFRCSMSIDTNTQEIGVIAMSGSKENAIDWFNDESFATVTISNHKILNYLLANQSEIEVLRKPEENDGYLLARVPKSWIRIRKQRKSRALSEEDKAAIAARLKAARKK